MITNYYTLRALVREWQEPIVGRTLADAFSQERGELTLAFAAEEGESMVRIGTRLPLQFMFRLDGYSKARRNVATLFAEAFGRQVRALTIADRDRIIFAGLDDGRRVQIVLFGPRANVLLIDKHGLIQDAFLRADELSGQAAPEPRPAPESKTFEDLSARWKADRKSVDRAIASAFPLFDREIAGEVAFRAGIDAAAAPDLEPTILRRILSAAKEVESELEQPSPSIYWDGPDPVLFSLLELRSGPSNHPERFTTVDEAARIFVQRSLARRAFAALFDPIESALMDAAKHYRHGATRMLEELSRESRAEHYEKWGHLLMASAHEIPAGAEEVELDDLFEEGATERIPLDPARSAIENAHEYYARARRTRRSREEAEKRLVETEQLADGAAQLLADLRESAHDLRTIQQFRKERADELSRYLSDEEAPGDRLPFRRFSLPEGYEVWVGRNARQNDDLTFHYAQKYDLWMHARGVAGSHAVLRKPNRDAEPGKHILQAAASIAAHFSKARGSGLVPVAVTQRKYVTKPRGAAPGAVRVEHEEVLIVEPRLPRR